MVVPPPLVGPQVVDKFQPLPANDASGEPWSGVSPETAIRMLLYYLTCALHSLFIRRSSSSFLEPSFDCDRWYSTIDSRQFRMPSSLMSDDVQMTYQTIFNAVLTDGSTVKRGVLQEFYSLALPHDRAGAGPVYHLPHIMVNAKNEACSWFVCDDTDVTRNTWRFVFHYSLNLKERFLALEAMQPVDFTCFQNTPFALPSGLLALLPSVVRQINVTRSPLQWATVYQNLRNFLERENEREPLRDWDYYRKMKNFDQLIQMLATLKSRVPLDNEPEDYNMGRRNQRWKFYEKKILQAMLEVIQEHNRRQTDLAPASILPEHMLFGPSASAGRLIGPASLGGMVPGLFQPNLTAGLGMQLGVWR